MSSPGWYPDPGHAPGRFRYWDGQAWSTTTTDHPGDPAPTAGRGLDSTAATVPSSGRRRTPLIIALTVGLVVVIVIALAVRAVLDVGSDGVTPPPTAPAGTLPSTEAAPTSPPTDGSSEPGRSVTPTPGDPTESADCPLGEPASRQPHPSDGRIHGGGLSFPQTANFIPTVQQSYFSWAYDVGGQDRAVAENWYSTYVVGALSTIDGFESPKQAAALVLACTISSGLYEGFTGRTEVSSRAATVDRRKGWVIRSEVRVDDPKVSVEGDTVVVIVIDTDSPESLAMFWACVPLGDAAALRQLEAVVKQLKVE